MSNWQSDGLSELGSNSDLAMVKLSDLVEVKLRV